MLGRAFHVLRRVLSTVPSVNTSPPLRVTERCASRLQTLISERGQSLALRVAVDGGGCSGFQYTFAIEEEGLAKGQGHERNAMDTATNAAPEQDLIFEEHGSKVRIDPISFAFVKGSTVDYVEEMISSSFRIINNPNSDSSCGCGTSFTAKMD